MTKEKKKERIKGRNLVKATMSTDAYWQVNKKVARKLGLEAAVILSDLLSKYDYHDERGELNKADEFFYTREDMEKFTTFSRKAQEKGLRKLRNAKMIEQHVEGMPAKRMFKINFNEIVEWMDTPDEEIPEDLGDE
jgi:hypothetical protein